MNKQTSTFIIEGNIGAGKSTLVALIQKKLDLHVVYEPHDQWQRVGGTENLLEKFYADTPRWAYTFQTYAFVSRVRAQEQHRKKYPHMPQVLERSVYSDRYCFAKNCFELGFMNMLEWQLYQEWFAWLVDNYTCPPQGFIYLRADPQICYKRLCKRDRKEEASVSLDYLKSLHDKHEKWLVHQEGVSDALTRVPVLTIDGNQEFADDAAIRQDILKQVQRFVETGGGHRPSLDRPMSIGL